MQAAAKAAHELGITTEATTQALFKAMENGELMADEFLPVFSEKLLEAANNGGALEKAMNNTGAAIGRFQTNIFLANKQFNEAGFDRGVRDLLNTMSTFIMESEELWRFLGSTAGFLAQALRAPFEVLTDLGEVFGFVTEKGKELNLNYNQMAFIFAAIFKWSRRLLAIFVLLPYTLSAISRAWNEGGIGNWATALGLAAGAALLFRKRIKGAVDLLKKGVDYTNRMRGSLAGESPTRSATRSSAPTPQSGSSRTSGIPFKGLGKIGMGIALFEGLRELLGGGEIMGGEGWSVKAPNISGMFDQRNTMPPLLGPHGGLQQGQLPFGQVIVDRIDINVQGSSDPQETARQTYLIFNEEVRKASMNEQTTEK